MKSDPVDTWRYGALVVLSLLASSMSHAAVDMEWVTIADAGNAPDTEIITCCKESIGEGGYGAVPYDYRIAKYEVTAVQYVEFLNAVAASDPNGLYPLDASYVIARSGTPGDYGYGVVAGKEAAAAPALSLWDGMRLANWMHNGQPVGPQIGATTEDGAYTITPAGIAANSIIRNPGARYFIPNDDEWYKAAFYDPDSMSYFDYPAGTDTPITCGWPTATPNFANCDGNGAPSNIDVGNYPESPSPYGTFDQGCNLLEWAETIVAGSERVYVVRLFRITDGLR